MKILINISNLYVGGGLQVALSFINELKQMMRKNEYHIFLSQAIDKQIDQEVYSDNFHFYLIEKSPASLKTRKQIVAKLDTLEEQIKPDVVFSVFGPSYWEPKAKHLTGFADGWVYNPESVAYDRLSFLKRIKMRLHGKYKSYYLKKDADYYVMETEDAKKRLAQTVGINEDNIFVVGNTYSSIFDDNDFIKEENEFYIKLPEKEEDKFRLMYIAHNHANKNIEVINDLLPLLEDTSIKFVLTLDETSFQNLFPNSTDKIINLGPIPQKSCPSVYKQCNALFAPTLLETFSAAYPEAMKMEKPILTSNYSFATDVCQDAA
ncbi:MAG TPA: glycosyltransferase family 1 protein, partial [Arcobacter sp.]|nr:glycosyltransferase family 1 protein [Arcobacter sp.]